MRSAWCAQPLTRLHSTLLERPSTKLWLSEETTQPAQVPGLAHQDLP